MKVEYEYRDGKKYYDIPITKISYTGMLVEAETVSQAVEILRHRFYECNPDMEKKLDERFFDAPFNYEIDRHWLNEFDDAYKGKGTLEEHIK